MTNYSFKIYTKANQLPLTWDEVAVNNVFLQSNYLEVLEKSEPKNMKCLFIGVFEKEILVGIILSQYLSTNKLESFGERDNCLKKYIRNYIFKNFASNTLFIGNNMVTGDNCFAFSKPFNYKLISKLLVECSDLVLDYHKKNNIKIHIVSFKDFYPNQSTALKENAFAPYFEYNVQPNMILTLDKGWKTEQDYVTNFKKKYRDQYKRARKKASELIIEELDFDKIRLYESEIDKLYHYVAKNAPFNTFFLQEKHFATLKERLGNQFKLVGYFLENKLIGFHTLILNGNVLETYFLGYDENYQKERMLYLNMLYNMTKYGIENNFEKIIFGRTALEIKSSIGADPVKMSGFIYHKNPIINKFLGKIFRKLEPQLVWEQRHPFNEVAL